MLLPAAIRWCEMLPRERKSRARSAFDVFDDESFAEQESQQEHALVAAIAPDGPDAEQHALVAAAPEELRSIVRAEVRVAVHRAQRRNQKALQKSASDLMLVTARESHGAWAAATVLHSIFPPSSGVAVSALGALGRRANENLFRPKR